jgi:DNA-binding PadR family transcriptional regulator
MTGMQDFFKGEALTEGSLEDVFSELIAAGYAETHGWNEDGERLYSLTESGRTYVRDVLFPQIGVSEEEAMAWMSERFG